MGEQERQRAEAELEKLDLEIRALKDQKPWVENFVRIVPVVTTMIAVLGLGFTIWQALNAQRQEHISKIQSQIRSDKEQILEFVTNDKISSVRVAFLIDDLNSLIRQLSDSEAETRVVTEQLMRVVWELPFDQRRDFDFDVAASRRWSDFRQFWKSYPDSHHLFLARKYYPRFERLHAEQTACIEKLDYADGARVVTYQNAGMPCSEGLINALIDAYEEHLKLIKETNQVDRMRNELKQFTAVTNNPGLANRLTQIYLGSESATPQP
jgi:seryl-tRNA synthetase